MQKETKSPPFFDRVEQLQTVMADESKQDEAASEWQAVSKPQPRRLAPQHTLSKADLGAKIQLDTKKKGAPAFFRSTLFYPFLIHRLYCAPH